MSIKLDNSIGKDVDSNSLNTDIEKILSINLKLLNLKIMYTVLIKKNSNREIK